MTIDRSQVSQALAKAIAYKQCGKDADAATCDAAAARNKMIKWQTGLNTI